MANATKYLLTAAAVVIIAGLAFTLATRGPAETETATDVIRIGVLAPLSGDLTVIGNRMRNAMELAKNDILREDGSLPIEIIYEDACFAQETLGAVRKLIEVDNVSIIGGSFCLFGHVPILPITEENKIITFNTAANPDEVLNKQYAFSTNFSIKEDAIKMAQYAFHELGARKAAIMHLQTPFGNNYDKYITEEFERLGGTITTHEPKTPDARDFRSEITKIKATQPDATFLIHFGPPLGTFIKQAKEAGLERVLIGDYESEDPSVLAAAQGAAEGLLFQSTAVSDDFKQRYQQAYGEEPDVIAANAYDAIHLQVAAYKQCGGDPDCTAENLRAVKDYPGASGRLTIEPDGSTSKPVIFKQVQNGQFVTLEE